MKILESLKNMTVEQLWAGGSPTSPTSAEPTSTTNVASSVTSTVPEKPTKEKRFLDDIRKLQENLRKTLDNVAIVEEEKMEAVVEAGGSGGAGSEVSEQMHRPVFSVPVQLKLYDRPCVFIVSSPSHLSPFRQRDLGRRSPSRSRRLLSLGRSGPVSFSVTHQCFANRVAANPASPLPVPEERCSLCWSGHQVRNIFFSRLFAFIFI